jgi:hypothetical protein
MGRKKPQVSKIAAKATAKLEAIAKATYQRKKTTTEVIPPDVSRAKAGAWLTLLSPITEWAGLKGDALNFKRRLLRIQQEETLLRVAQSVRTKLADTHISRPIPRKILVPALEKASLEDAADDVMVDRWANLLASAAQELKVQPRFVGILEELAGSQAECLERVAFNRFAEVGFPAAEFADSCISFAEHNIREDFEADIRQNLTGEEQIEATVNAITRAFNRPGVLLGVVFISDSRGGFWDCYDAIAQSGIQDEENLSILESLGLIRYVVIKTVVHAKRRFQVSVHYHHLTRLGVEFCEVCSKPRLHELEQIDEASGRKNFAPVYPSIFQKQAPSK